MNPKLFRVIIIVLILSALFFGFQIINLQVSLKYEVDDPSNCISKRTGINLCQAIEIVKGISILSAIMVCVLMFYKRKIVR
jgi:hypothetical protein